MLLLGSDGVVCGSCNDAVAIGDLCDTRRGPVENCGPGNSHEGLCFECVEGFYSSLDSCHQCHGARRCENETAHQLCPDNAMLQNGRCTASAPSHVLLAVDNHVVKCEEAFFVQPEACGECPESCLQCTDTTTCTLCGDSVSHLGACIVEENATAQTHNGIVSCDDGFILDGRTCRSCSDRHASTCPNCTLCSLDQCLRCEGHVVFADGRWKEPSLCDETTGTLCTRCSPGALAFNATDCVVADDCVQFVDGVCVHCADSLINVNGSCHPPEQCSSLGDGTCLRCDPGTFADRDGVCHRLGARL